LERLASRITADADEDKAAADQLTADLKQINATTTPLRPG
jgi:hypothetical protein